MNAHVSEADAQEVLQAVRTAYAAWVSPGNEPTLRKDYDDGYGLVPYAITWEGGAYDWPVLFPDGGIEEEFGARIRATSLPDRIFCEALNGWSLGIYPS